MGKASRRKKVTNPANRPAYRAPIPFVDRPYEGLSAEKDLVAMREIIPAATLTARTNDKYGNEDVIIATLAPEGYPALVRKDGAIVIGLQTRSNSGDLSHDAGAAIIAAMQYKEDGGQGVVDLDVREPAPRLQDVLDLDSFNEKYGNAEVIIATLAPEGYPALVRTDGAIVIGLQTRSNSGDLSHDAGAAIVAALQYKEDGGQGVVDLDVREPAPRLQEVLDLDSFGTMELHSDFSFWFNPNEELDAETKHALEHSAEEFIETVAVPGVSGMFWASMNSNFVRYVTDIDESKLFTALARLHAAGKANLGEGTRFWRFPRCGHCHPCFRGCA